MKKLLLGLLLAVAPLPVSAAQVFLLQTPVNQTTASPTISGAGDTVAYVAGGASIILENGLIVSCTCAQLDSATVTISAGTFTGDTLSAAVTAGITAVYSSPTLTLSGTANVSAYVQVLQSVTFSSSNADPTNSGGNLTRTVTWTANNGAHASNQPTTTINVSTPTAAPTLANAGSTDTFTSGGSPTVIEPGITTACSCSNLTGATVSISGGLLALDTLDATTVGSITKAYDSSTGVLTLSGTDTKANYRTVLQSVTYSSGLADPTNGGADTSRAISWVASNGASNSAAVTSTIITQNPAVPTIVVAAGNSISYTSGAVGVAVDNVLSVSCTCANLSGATLTLSSGFFNGDILAVSTAFGIAPVYNSVTGVISLSGTSTVANYQTLLRTILYRSSAGDPSNGGHNATRTATWVASNGANVSFPATTTINVFLTGQPTWAMTGAVVALNPSINQAWVSGSGTGPLSSQITVTRATQETCYTGVVPTAVTYAPANVACATGSGLAVWPAYTNYLTRSNDFSDSSSTGWVTYTGSAAGSSVAVVGNSVTDPTNVTSQAAKVTLARTSTGNFAAVINNTINAPAGTYSGGIWVQADPSDPGSVGKSVQFAFLSSAGFYVRNLVLTANWQWFQFSSIGNLANGCAGASQTCQFQVGLTNQPGSGTANTTLAVTFDVWGGELNGGANAFPTIATAGAPVAVQADNIAVTAGSALETALTGAASSVIMNSVLGVQNQVATLLDSNGTTWLGEAAANQLTTAVGTTLNTSNIGQWASPLVFGIARDGTGRTMGLNGLVIAKDTQGTAIATPLSLGSTLGTSNFFSGYLGILNAFSTRVDDSLLGVTGVGTSYFFANNATCLAIAAGTNGSCSDSNSCTLLQPCVSITKANSIALVTNDVMSFNGGDTFVGCLTETGGANWNATVVFPATIKSYGSGQATMTPNCTGPYIGVFNFHNVDGAIINNLNFVGDTAGNTGAGLYFADTTRSTNHGDVLIENNNFSGFHTPTALFGLGAITFNNNNGQRQYQNYTILNNTDMGATSSATDNNFINMFSDGCTIVNLIAQGNLVANLGGLNVNNSAEGNGIFFSGVCPPGSVPYTEYSVPANPTTGALAQFNVTHDMSKNSLACGGPFSDWAYIASGVIFRMNEVYNTLATGNSCDHGAFDLDIDVRSSLVERNYTHNNFGPCILMFSAASGATSTVDFDTARWNICDEDNVTGSVGVASTSTNSTRFFIYNNVFVQSPTGLNTGGSPSFVVGFNGCPGTGSLFANNIIVDATTAGFNNNRFLNVSQSNTTNICQVPPSGGVIITHNDWWPRRTSGVNWQAWIDNQGATGTWTASISGTTATVSASTGVIKTGMEIIGTGVTASTYALSCTAPSPCNSFPQTWTISKAANVASETLNLVAAASTTFQLFENLINEHDGLNVDPLFVNAYQNVTCNSTAGSAGPQPCPAGFALQGGSPMHGAGAILTSAPWNLPNPGLYNGQGTKDYFGATLPCAAPNASFPIGASC